MVSQKTLEQKIEQLRQEMYQAYNTGESENNVLRISEELDMLLNQLQKLKGS
ncbi:MAG TPA: aspartyl-phosphate phosphatase Spo0E family protein [Bacillota bacterium]|nr:aspartyl-phosphate phosphatase Spo0E family protein [Bacillota bacterium]